MKSYSNEDIRRDRARDAMNPAEGLPSIDVIRDTLATVLDNLPCNIKADLDAIEYDFAEGITGYLLTAVREDGLSVAVSWRVGWGDPRIRRASSNPIRIKRPDETTILARVMKGLFSTQRGCRDEKR